MHKTSITFMIVHHKGQPIYYQAHYNFKIYTANHNNADVIIESDSELITTFRRTVVLF